MTFAAVLGIGPGLALGRAALQLSVAIAEAGVTAFAFFQATKQCRAVGAHTGS